MIGLKIAISLVVYGVFLACAIRYNFEFKDKYDQLMSYLNLHHPEIATQIGLKQVFGHFYMTGAYGPSVKFARKHEPLGDPIAEELLSDYARFADRGMLFTLAFVFLVAILYVVWNL